MKKKCLLLSIISLLSISLGACSTTKDNSNNNEIKSIYELYKANGGNQTYEEWLESIKGPKGDKGDAGETGPAGAKGDKGEPGEAGKSAYEIYCEQNPNYNKTESEWLDELANGLLGRKEQHLVTFNKNSSDCEEYSSQTILHGEKIEKPSDPFKLGYTFTGWNYKNEPWAFTGFPVTEDMTLTADYEVDYYEMPAIFINTNGKAIDSNETYTKSTISVSNSVDYDFSDISAGVRLRGNSTSHTPKKPYRIKFDKKQNMLGLNGNNKFKSWVLLADYYDTSLLRNWLTFKYAEVFDFYSSDCKHVELFLNGEYQGVYLLAEQQQIDAKRINVEEYKDGQANIDDTGYLLVEDFAWIVEEPNITATLGEKELWFEVKSDTVLESQLNYIQNYLQDAFDVLSVNESTQIQLAEYFDIDSAVEMALYLMLIDDGDPNSSFYMYKDHDGVLSFGAPWDEDWALGNERDRVNAPNTIKINDIMTEFIKYDWFNSLVKNKWDTKKAYINTLPDLLDDEKEATTKSLERNFERWDDIIGQVISYQPAIYSTFTTYEEVYSYFRNWLTDRISFLDNHFSE